MRFEIAEACTGAAICLCMVARLTQDVQDGRWPIHLRPGTIAFQASMDEHENKLSYTESQHAVYWTAGQDLDGRIDPKTA